MGSRAAHLEVGRRGEELAARHLRRQRYKVLYRNFRPAGGGGEIDLVCRDGRMLVFVEVKTRSAGGTGRPADAVDGNKEEAMTQGAREWLRMLGEEEVPVRFDIVEVVLGEGRPEITVTRNAVREEGREV